MNRGKKLLLLLMLKLLKLFSDGKATEPCLQKGGKFSKKQIYEQLLYWAFLLCIYLKWQPFDWWKSTIFCKKNNWTDSVEINRSNHFCPKLVFGQIANTFKPKVWLNFRYEVCSLLTKYIAKPELFHSREPWYFQAKTAYLTSNIKKDSCIKKNLVK